MHWIEALHVIAMVTWFAGLFYLPRLFVYHTQVKDSVGNQRFKVMEKKLFYYITTPGGILTSFFGLWLLSLNYEAYSHMMWLHIKLILVACLWLFHIYCGFLLHAFMHDKNKHSEKFYRIINEIPTVILITVIILVYVKP
ncbi:MAG: TIGR00701 family protein [Legionellales bacterium]|nr:TIGR00701 family protein [Legionellales bacterium]